MIESAGSLFEELVEIMARLRGENGCPWDREQTSESIKPYLIEETYEVLEAIRLGAAGVVLKEMAPKLLVQCIRKAHAGEQWLEKRSVSLALEKLLSMRPLRARSPGF